MAIINVPAPVQIPGLFGALGSGLQNAALGFNRGLEQRRQQQALQQLAAQQGINLPPGLPPQIAQQLILGQLGQQPGFTLGPGQQRFGAGGQPIAQVAPAPIPPTKPTAFQETTAEINRLAGIPEFNRTPVEQRRLDQLLGGADEDTVSQLRAREIKRLQAKKQKTPEEKASLKKLLEGGPLVEIGLGKPASASERTAIAETRASIDALDNLKTLFDSPQTKTGPIVGRISPTAGLIGRTTQEQEDFMAATSTFKNSVIKDITGAQMSEPEAKRIMKQIPDITDPPARWNAKWRQTQKNLKAIQRRRAEVLKQSGLRAPGESGATNVNITVDDIANKFGF